MDLSNYLKLYIVLETEMDELLKHYNDFSEVKQYTLK